MSVLLHESNQPLTSHRQLVEYFSSAAKPKEEWLIGCEHEKFAYHLSNLKPVSYGEPNGLRDFLLAMQDNFGWKPVMEGDHIIGLTRAGANVSFEPGGQVELSGAPLQNLHETSAEIDQHMVEINEVGKKLGIGFLGIGFHPTARREDIQLVPKARYEIQKKNMPIKGPMALDMMLRTCTVQVNLDFSDEADMIKKFRTSLALQPIATALFASSPFTEGKLNGFNSYRMHVWENMDPDRSGIIPFVFENGFGFERYADYALNVPMQFIYRDEHYIDCYGQSFRAFMDGKLPALPGELPTINDWANHLTTIFPDVRLKKILEMRGADAGSNEMLLALPAFWTGIMYDTAALDAAAELVKDWSAEERAQLRKDVARRGFHAEMRGRSVRDLCNDALLISQQGLRRRAIRLHGGADESRYIDILFDYLDSNQNRSDLLIMHQEHYKDFTMQKLFDMSRLLPPPDLREKN